MQTESFTSLAERLRDALLACGWQLATAESCTGGWLAKVITDLAGSSQWFERGWVTYSNVAKQQQLGVDEATLQAYGAVSAATVKAMASGALGRSQAQLTVAISGIAGPGGGTAEKPVGTVWLGYAGKDRAPEAEHCLFAGERDAVRAQAVEAALRGLCERLDLGAGRG